ncbi:hypothetical protein OU997_03210 [Pseudomonas sp. SL4(2022)]|uniref:hypothetical protein n=1 Tax=Pseudomonas sp. SL4(2022) TaxID=2994661 RepID=UPI0022707352|nr:hypothetical protein [Pseudomonas sp. SL4(2022)]WAC45217.1 hypothetical protein OU997_03210 [Pseudomonas sp. SL4(2022)]
MLYLTDAQPAYCPKCGKPIELRLYGWEAQDRFYNAKQPFLCDCGARYLLKEDAVTRAFDHAEPVGGDAGFDRAAKVNLLSELYVILGALDAPETVLDQVLAAIEDDSLPYPTLLPFEYE